MPKSRHLITAKVRVYICIGGVIVGNCFSLRRKTYSKDNAILFLLFNVYQIFNHINMVIAKNVEAVKVSGIESIYRLTCK